MSRARGSLDSSGGLCPCTVGAVPGACSWIPWWRGQRLGLPVGVLAVTTPTRLWSSCGCVLLAESMCARTGALWRSCPSSVCPSSGALPLAGLGSFPVLPRWPQSSVCRLSLQLSPILPPSLTSDAQASSTRPLHTPVDTRLRLGRAGWRSPCRAGHLLCLLLAGSCALL